MQKPKISLKSLLKKQIFIPLAALFILAVFNLIYDASFFSIVMGENSVGDPVLLGNLITILDTGSELAILAIGMTLVTAASGGQDISVGAGIAITGSVMLRMLCGTDQSNTELQVPIIVAFLVAVLAGMACGAFNGMLVSIFKIQPMVATLILFTAGRSIGSWINQGKLPMVHDPSYKTLGEYLPGIPIPTPFLIAVAVTIIFALILKFTNLRLYVQSVGINAKSSRLNGLNPTFIKFITFVILGVCVAICGLIKTARLETINYSTIAKDIEMDAILAVALGGNALSGGKFSVSASILGAYIIPFLTMTLYKLQVPPTALPACKAVVVILLVVFSAPVVRDFISAKWKLITSKKSSKEVA